MHSFFLEIKISIQASQDLESRIVALEKGATYDATQKAIREREIGFLQQLREIKETMANEAAAAGGSGGKSSTEVKNLEEENKKLKAQIAKMEYRIKHLVSGMEEFLKK